MKLVYPIFLFTLLTSLPFQFPVNAEASTSIPVKVAVPSFSNLSNLDDFIRDDHLLGSPTLPYITNQGAVMTTTGGQTSSLFTKTQMAKANLSSPGFSTYFLIDIYKTNSGVPADGYVFTLANNTSTLGSTGGGLGYAGVPNSVGVIFDFFQNTPSEVVASTDVFTNGSLSSRTGSGFDPSFMNAWYGTALNQKVRSLHTWIEYDAASATIAIRVSPDNANRPVNATRIQNNLTLDQISEFYYAGFSAATGGSSMSVVLNQWYFASEYIIGGINLNTNAYIVDNTPPTAPLISTQFNENQHTFTVEGGTDDNGVSSYQVKKPGGNWLTYEEEIIMDTIGLYEARTVDNVGNFSTTTTKIGLWEIQFVGIAGVLKTLRLLSNETYEIHEQLSDDIFRYTTWLYNNQPIDTIVEPTQSMQLIGEGLRYVFTLNFSLNGGVAQSPLPLSYTLGSVWENPLVTFEGHTFAGWYLDEALTIPFEDQSVEISSAVITLHAKWNANTYAISFETMGGNSIADLNVTYGLPILLPPPPVRVGFTFAGWYWDERYEEEVTVPETMPAFNLIWYAKWTINIHTVSFMDASGEVVLYYPKAYGSFLDTFPSVSRPGYRFLGWSILGNEVDFSTFTMPDAPVIFLPIFEGLTVELLLITYDGNLSIQATSGQPIGELPIPSMHNQYQFIGWSLSPLDATQIIDADYIVPNVETLNLFPIWEELSSPIQPNKYPVMSVTLLDSLGATLTWISVFTFFTLYVVKTMKEESYHG